MKLRYAAIFSTLALISCKGDVGNDAGKAATEVTANTIERYLTELSKISANLSTPDETVKSFYEFLNKEKEFNCRINKDYSKEEKEKIAYEQRFIAGDFLTFIKNIHSKESLEECLKNVDRRSVEITEVKIETPTRAIVFATLRNVSNIPEGAEPSEWHMKRRKEGENYKYELTSSEGRWKISQIYKNDILTEGKWEAVFDPNEAPQIPSYVSYYY